MEPALTNLSLHILPPKHYSTHSYFQLPQLDNKKPLISAYNLVQASYPFPLKKMYTLCSDLMFIFLVAKLLAVFTWLGQTSKWVSLNSILRNLRNYIGISF